MATFGNNMREVVNVLVVDDDEVDAEFIRHLFKKENIVNPLYHVANGIEALEIIRGDSSRKKIPKPFIILLDINMPMMNGIEFLQELRNDENLKDSVVFILTTSPREEDKSITYKLNVAGYFLKKDIKELISMFNLYWHFNEFSEYKAEVERVN